MNMTSSILEKGYCFISSMWKVPCISFCIVLQEQPLRRNQIEVSIIIKTTASNLSTMFSTSQTALVEIVWASNSGQQNKHFEPHKLLQNNHHQHNQWLQKQPISKMASHLPVNSKKHKFN